MFPNSFKQKEQKNNKINKKINLKKHKKQVTARVTYELKLFQLKGNPK
jgi:hypothetical protein